LIPLFRSFFFTMVPSFFTEKDFSRILNNVNGYGIVFLDRIRERQWYGLVYDNSEYDAYYCPALVTKFYTHLDASTIDLDLNQFRVHFDTGDLLVNIDTIEAVTQIPSPPQHAAPITTNRLHGFDGCEVH